MQQILARDATAMIHEAHHTFVHTDIFLPPLQFYPPKSWQLVQTMHHAQSAISSVIVRKYIGVFTASEPDSHERLPDCPSGFWRPHTKANHHRIVFWWTNSWQRHQPTTTTFGAVAVAIIKEINNNGACVTTGCLEQRRIRVSDVRQNPLSVTNARGGRLSTYDTIQKFIIK